MAAKQSKNMLAPFIVLIIVILGLELIIKIFNIPRQILPAPTAIIKVLTAEFKVNILSHFLITIQVIMTGFVIGVPTGIFCAALLTQFKILEKAFSPYVIMLVTTPFIILVPIFMLWMGFGINVRILAVTLQTIPIVMLNSLSGFNNVEKVKIDLMKSLGANKVQTFMKIIFPNALPQVFTGIKLGGIFSTIAAISAEFAGARTGLGSRIVYFSSFIETELAFGCILITALIGITLFNLISMIERKIIIWKN
jgi:ABC-type nitrate/sulfonate/bicarbonate transport system permease component